MREILFRGKRIDNGEWIEGQLLHFTSSVGNHELSIIVESCEWDNANEWFNLGKRAKVDPETVGQYTGLTDKNGKKIFEGDIISEKPPMNEIAYIGYVAYDEEAAVWRFMINNDGKYNGVLFGTYSRSYTVIGNIHDNPELMEGDKND